MLSLRAYLFRAPKQDGFEVETLKEQRTADILLVVILYSLAHGLLLVNTGIYWDDWTIVGVDPQTVLDIFNQTRTPWAGQMHSFLLSLSYGLPIYRAIVFLSFLLSSLLVNAILSSIDSIDRNNRLILVLFFSLFPVNSARVAIINAPYAITYLLFFLGFWVLTKYVNKGFILLRIISLLLFLLSFTTNSLLFLYAIVIVYLSYQHISINSVVLLLKKIMLSYFDFIAAPIVFWVVKVTLLRPYGVYANYNSINVKNLFRAFPRSLALFYSSFVEVIDESIRFAVDAPSMTFILSILLMLFLKRKILVPNDHESKKHVWLMMVGICCFFLAVFPYLSVGKIPTLYTWDSRHQLLIPLGASFLLTYGLNVIFQYLCVDDRYKYLIFSFLTVSFICFNINRYISMEKDWYKHVSLVENFKSIDKIRSNTTFYFDDKTIELNATKKDYAWYEYTGLMKMAFGDETRFGSPKKSFNEDMLRVKNWYGSKNSNAKMDFLIARNIRNYRPHDSECEVIITKGERQLQDNEVLGYISDKFFRRSKFIEKVKELFTIQVVARGGQCS